MTLNLNSKWYDIAGKPMKPICCFPMSYGIVKQNLPEPFLSRVSDYESSAVDIFQLGFAICASKFNIGFLFRFFMNLCWIKFPNMCHHQWYLDKPQIQWFCFSLYILFTECHKGHIIIWVAQSCFRAMICWRQNHNWSILSPFILNTGFFVNTWFEIGCDP